MNNKLKNDLLLKACRREPTPRTPIWIMRQAGRYLPEYQKVRAKADFLTMCHTPELAAEVTLQPIDIIGVDAAIIFSDILVIPAAMGMPLNFTEGRGPVFEKPLQSAAEIAALRLVEPESDLSSVLDAIKLVKKELDGRVPVIGFAGAPWTLASYMIEGSGSKNFTKIKGLMYSEPDTLLSLLNKLSDAVADLLLAQIKAGADVVQIFDSWAGILTPEYFKKFSMPFLKDVVQKVKKAGVPVILFARDAGHSFPELAEIGADVLSVSWTEDLEQARQAVGSKVGLQGNLDPSALFAPKEVLLRETKNVLQKAGSHPGYIFNLGHGILPKTPVDNAKALVEFVKEESAKMNTQN